ncbi:MAG: carboxypeptidase-like regulatory domain-containing protein [Acidobacteriota bacterium]
MRTLLRRVLSLLLVSMLVLPLTAIAAPPAAAANASEVRGVLLSADGTPALGFQIGLRSKTGDLFLSAPTGADGAFAVESLPPDTYRVVAFAPDGAEFPVLGREVALKAGQVERIEARLAEKSISPGSLQGASDKGAAAGTTSKKRGFAGFWGTTGGKIAVIVGGAFAVGLIASSGGDNNKERNPSPSVP